MERFCHGGDIYLESAPSGKWLDFSANINPLGMPDFVRKAILEHMDDIVHYPEPDARSLRQVLAESEGLSPENLILGNGAAELFYLFFYTVRPKHVLIPIPSFSEYERSARAAGSEVVFFPLLPQEDFVPDMEKLMSCAAESDCLIMGNPNNPTGTLIPVDDLKRLVRCCEEHGCWLIMDESFLDFREDRAKYTLQHLVKQYEKLIVLRSLTKFYAIPGLRLGFGLVPSELRSRMEAGKDVWNVNLFAQYAGRAAVANVEYAEKTRKLLREEQVYMTNFMKQLPVEKVFEPAVNFMLVKCGNNRLSKHVLKGMKERGILLRNCSNYPGLESGGYLRMAIRSHWENEIVLQAWKDILREAVE